MVAPAASTPLPNRLQGLPFDTQEELFTCLTPRDLCALSGVCRGLHKSISGTQDRESGCVQTTLAAYRSRAHVLGSLEQLPALGQLDRNIRELDGRLRGIREAQLAIPEQHRDPAEEIAIEEGLNTLQASRLPNDQFSRRVIDLVMDYYQDHPTHQTPSRVIDTRQWNALIGEVPNKPLLPGTETLLRQPCSLFRGKTKDETHICVDIPPTVDGQPLTLKRVRDFAEQNRGNRIRLNIYWGRCYRILQELGDVPIPPGQYLLLKTCLPGTKGKTYQEQLEVLERHPEYTVATLPQVLVASLMEYIQSGRAKTRLFEEEYARTSTTVGNWRLAFGDSGWPCVYDDGGGSALDQGGLAVVHRSGGSSPPKLPS